MSWVRNLLISVGAYWLSRQPVALTAWAFGKINSGIIYGGGLGDAIAMGIMTSMGRAVCASLGAAIVTLSATGVKPQRWAWVVALLYVVTPRHQHWLVHPTKWDRLWQGVDLLWPAVACIIIATVISRLRRDSGMATENKASATLS